MLGEKTFLAPRNLSMSMIRVQLLFYCRRYQYGKAFKQAISFTYTSSGKEKKTPFTT